MGIICARCRRALQENCHAVATKLWKEGEGKESSGEGVEDRVAAARYLHPNWNNTTHRRRCYTR